LLRIDGLICLPKDRAERKDAMRIALPTYQPLVYISSEPSYEEMVEMCISLEDTNKLTAYRDNWS
jgi:hypothetical protein